MDLNSQTFLYGVIGDPVSHSLSPVMHNRAFSHVGWPGVYLAFKVRDLSSAVGGIRALGIKGVSVTIPHKVAVMEFIDELDPDAENIGAVNTIINRNGRLFGYNTDSGGALAALAQKATLPNKDVAIVGAGGAARAIGYGVVAKGAKLTVFNRSKDKGERLARDLGADFSPLADFGKIGCQILINTTPVGMTPNIGEMPIDSKDLDQKMVVMDIVYNPLRTRLLRQAETMGCKTIDGVSMFVHQGVLQFEMWTGQKAPMDVMRKAVLDALGEGF